MTLITKTEGIYWIEQLDLSANDLLQLHTEIEELLPEARVEIDRFRVLLQELVALAESRGYQVEALKSRLAECNGGSAQ